VFGGMSSDGSTLKNAFLDDSNNIRWQELGGAIVGAGAVQAFRSVAAIPLGVAAAIRDGLGSIASAVNSGGEMLTATISQNQLFASVGFGVFSLPVGVLLVLLSVAIIVIGYRQVVLNQR
jgi:hypothetical protein